MSELLKAKALAAGGIEWTWWTSNSVLRLTSNLHRGLRDGDVLSAVSSMDGTPLLAIAEPYRDFIEAATPAAILDLIADNERLRGLKPDFPPRPPEGFGLPRYGLRWNGPSVPLAVQMDDGYWTPWHLAEQVEASHEALREPVAVTAVAVVRERNDEKRVEWLLEGGIAELEPGQLLIVVDQDVTDENGDGELYRYLPEHPIQASEA